MKNICACYRHSLKEISMASHPGDVFATLNKEQLAVKIAYDITQYPKTDNQVKLSLLQDLIITLLPGTATFGRVRSAERCGTGNPGPTYRKLQSVRCHKNSEDVMGWLDAMLIAYLQSPSGAQTFQTLSSTQVATPY